MEEQKQDQTPAADPEVTKDPAPVPAGDLGHRLPEPASEPAPEQEPA